MMTHKILEDKFKAAFAALGFDPKFPVVLKESSRPKFGDYQVNGVMGIAKELKDNPRELANKIVLQVDKEDLIEKLEVAGPGFINVTLANKYLGKVLNKELTDVSAENLHKIVIDYSSPNLAKEMHVGHLRSTIIGDALVRMHEFVGDTVIRRNHVGDWGTQFGMLVAYLLESSGGKDDLGLELADLEEFYRSAKKRFDEDEEFAERARKYVVKLQAKDPEVLELWKKFVKVSLSHCQKIYDRLGVKLIPEDAVGESAYNDLLPQVVSELWQHKIAVDNEGAKCVFFDSEDIGTQEATPFIIQKSDGAYLYSTTDIAAAHDRIKNLNADYLLYVIDARQSLHLKQLFATIRKAGWSNPETIMEHVAFGVMLGDDNKPFKTRTGGTVKLSALIDEAVTRAKVLVRDHNQEWSDDRVDELAEALGVAAIKYADLSKNRVSDYIFNFDQILAFDGNTAPYMLYAYVRINSIFKKAGLSMADYLDRPISITQKEEHALALHLARFSDRVLQATKENCPHYICSYIYELAGLFMRFYESCPIIDANDQVTKESRLALAALTAEILKTSLSLLGIGVVEQM